MIKFTLPIPPSANQLFVSVNGNVGGRTRAKGKAYGQWLHDAGWEIKRQCVPCGLTRVASFFAEKARYGIWIEANLNDRRDIDNILKPLLDLLVRMEIIKDDRYVDDLHIARNGKIEGVTVSVRCL